MKLETWLKSAVKTLSSEGITTAQLDSLILLEDILDKNRAWLLAHPEYEIDHKLATQLGKSVERRATHEPLAYIRGKSEFYGRTFKITPATLQPRPETETMIDALKKLELSRNSVITDVGTGSGAIAITAKLELDHVTVLAVEINKDALKIAKQNAKNLETDIQFYLGNLLEPLTNKKIDVILANLPYVPDSHTINQAAMQEPAIAIFGGEDGLDLYRQLFNQLKTGKYGNPAVLTESLPFQHTELKQIAASAGYKQISEEDFIQVFILT